MDVGLDLMMEDERNMRNGFSDGIRAAQEGRVYDMIEHGLYAFAYKLGFNLKAASGDNRPEEKSQ